MHQCKECVDLCGHSVLLYRLVLYSNCRIGSDEDDESVDDESQSNEDPSETAVSIDAARRKNNSDNIPDSSSRQDSTADSGTAQGEENKPGQAPPTLSGDQSRDADQGASSGKMESQAIEHLNGDVRWLTLHFPKCTTYFSVFLVHLVFV